MDGGGQKLELGTVEEAAVTKAMAEEAVAVADVSSATTLGFGLPPPPHVSKARRVWITPTGKAEGTATAARW